MMTPTGAAAQTLPPADWPGGLEAGPDFLQPEDEFVPPMPELYQTAAIFCGDEDGMENRTPGE
jgi:hypothetical protein